MNETKTRTYPDDTEITLQSMRQIVLGMLRIIEDPNSTREEAQRACSTIRDAFDAQQDNRLDGENHKGCEVGDATIIPAIDRDIAKLDSQENDFWDALQQIMKLKAITQSELASRLGSTQPAISQMINRRCRPQRNSILRIADALGVDPRNLWPDLEVTEILDTIAAVQEDQEMSQAESEVIRRTLKRPVANSPAAPLPKRKR